jgi:hypothetical protein
VSARQIDPEKQFRGGSRPFLGFGVSSILADHPPCSGGASSDEGLSDDRSGSDTEYSPSDRCGSELDFDFPSDECSSGEERETDESDAGHSGCPTLPTRNGPGAAGSSRRAAAGSDGELQIDFPDGWSDGGDSEDDGDDDDDDDGDEDDDEDDVYGSEDDEDDDDDENDLVDDSDDDATEDDVLADWIDDEDVEEIRSIRMPNRGGRRWPQWTEKAWQEYEGKVWKDYELLSQTSKWKRAQLYQDCIGGWLHHALTSEYHRFFGADGGDRSRAATWSVLKRMFAGELKEYAETKQQARILKDYALLCSMQFRQARPKSHRRTVIASKLFDDRGRLLLFKTIKAAAKSLQCHRSSILRGRRHARMHGPGVTVRHRRNRKKNALLSQELDAFVEECGALRPSSCKANGDGSPIIYLMRPVAELWREFQNSHHPNACGRTAFFKHFADTRFQKIDLLGGLCSVCDSTGYAVQRILAKIWKQCASGDEALAKNHAVISWIHHVRREVSLQSEHAAAPTHCYEFATGSCSADHMHSCRSCLSIFDILDETRTLLQESISIQNDPLWTHFNTLEAAACDFIAHRMRTKAIGVVFSRELSELAADQGMLIFDFKQKLMKLQSRECQQDYFGKSAFASLFGCAVITKPQLADEQAWQIPRTRRRRRVTNEGVASLTSSTRFKVQMIDIWSSDTSQDKVWVLSALEVVSVALREMAPDITSFKLWSDNAGCFHNTSLAKCTPLIFQKAGIQIRSHRFFEAGEGKSVVDRHFATVKHAIDRSVKANCPFETGLDVERVLSTLAGVTVFKMTPHRSSKLFEMPKLATIRDVNDWQYMEARLLAYDHISDHHVAPPKYTIGLPPLSSIAAPQSATTIAAADPSASAPRRRGRPRRADQGAGDVNTAASSSSSTAPVIASTVEQASTPLTSSERLLPISKGVFERSSLPPCQKVLPPIVKTLYGRPPVLRPEDLQPRRSGTDLFSRGWALPKPKPRKRYHALITRALLYYFWLGEVPGNRKETPRVIYEHLCRLVAAGHLGHAEVISEKRVKEWMNSKTQKRKNSPTSFVPPVWFNAGQESCIWENQNE